MDQSYIGRWIVRLDGYHMIIELRMRDKHQNADKLNKKTEFYERWEQRQANQAEIKEGFPFWDKATYEALPLTRWLDKSGHPIPENPELPVEKAAKIKILSKKDPVPLDLLLRSNLVQQELSRMNINSLSLLDKTLTASERSSIFKRWIKNGAADKGDLEEDSYRILRQYLMQKEGRLYLIKDGILACKRGKEDKVLYKYNAIVLPQLYQTELLFRSHDQMGHQRIDKVSKVMQMLGGLFEKEVTRDDPEWAAAMASLTV